MSTAVLDRTAPPEPHARPTPTRSTYVRRGFRLVGDFNCPASYLAFRRAAVLAAAGAHVDWHAVEHAPGVPGGRRAATTLEQLHRVRELLLPGEELPHHPVAFVPSTRAAVTAYAEAYAAGAAEAARRVIFESFWQDGIDIGDPNIVRFLLVDQLRGGSSASETVRDWGYAVDGTGGAISMAAWRLVHAWSREWRATALGVPLLQPEDGRPLVGTDALDWLGRAVVEHGLDPALPAAAPTFAPDPRELPSRSWVTQHGGHWQRQAQWGAAARRSGQ